MQYTSWSWVTRRENAVSRKSHCLKNSFCHTKLQLRSTVWQRGTPAAEGAEALFEGSPLEPVMQEEVGAVQQHSIAPVPLV